ncbi:MAG: tryptophan 7-halogenase [Acidobacteriota bacterium]|nr:tryptophan 7-halogenase [Acidobacteriota bacterium]
MRGTPDMQRDVIVIGAGPAGSTAATLTAKHGHDVMLLERDTFPRFRIGESLMPATYWTLDRLGIQDKLHCDMFQEKHSVQFFNGAGRGAAPFYFAEFDDHPSSQTWQVERAKFDKLLLDHAADCGVDVHQKANVKEILFDGDTVIGVDVEFGDGRREKIHSKVVVDASGQSSMLARKFGLRRYDSKLRHAAVFTRFKGAQRGEGRDEGATVILQTTDNYSWFWYIPLPDNIVSVGVVGPIDRLVSNRKGSPQEIFDAERDACPGLQERIASATQMDDVKVLRDFSYVSSRIAGDGWVLAGDAFGFLDPIYSTGVFLAFKGAEMAADSIHESLESGDLSGNSLGRHGATFLDGMEKMRKLVYAYYDKDFHIPSFLKQHPECREPLVDLLVGNVFRRPTDHLFEALGRFCTLPEQRTLDGTPSST